MGHYIFTSTISIAIKQTYLTLTATHFCVSIMYVFKLFDDSENELVGMKLGAYLIFVFSKDYIELDTTAFV